MPKFSNFVGFIAAILTPTVLQAMPGPFIEYRIVEPTGRFYAVVKPLPPVESAIGRWGIPVEIWLAERGESAPEVKPAEGPANPDVALRRDDKLHGRVVLEGAPLGIVISSSGLGFAAFDVAGKKLNGNQPDEFRNDAVVIVSGNGAVKFRMPMSALFTDDDLKEFPEFVCPWGRLWYGGGWIDEEQRDLIIVGGRMASQPKMRLFRTINLDTGKVSHASSEVIVKALQQVNRGALELALELTNEMQMEAARPMLPVILADDRLPAAARLRAAVAMAGFGDLVGAELIADAALNSADAYAVRNLSLLGESGAALARGAIARHGATVSNEAIAALSSMRKAAVATLIEMLENDQDPTGQEAAFKVVSKLGDGASDAVPTLSKFLKRTEAGREGRRSLQSMAAVALGNIGPGAKMALPALREFRNRAKASWDVLRRAATKKDAPDRVDTDKAASDKTDYISAVQAINKIEPRRTARKKTR